MNFKCIQNIHIQENTIGLVWSNEHLTDILPEGKHLILGPKQVMVIRKEGDIKGELAQKIIEHMPAMAAQISTCKVGPKQLAIHYVDGNIVGTIREPGFYASWNHIEKHQYHVLDLGDPDIVWQKADKKLRKYLRDQELFSVIEFKRGIVLHYQNNYLEEVIEMPGCYAFCNIDNIHELVPITPDVECSVNNIAQESLLELYIHREHVGHNQILMRYLNNTLYQIIETEGDYYFWKLPDFEETYDIIDCDTLEVSENAKTQLRYAEEHVLPYRNNQWTSTRYSAQMEEARKRLYEMVYNDVNYGYLLLMVSGDCIVQQIRLGNNPENSNSQISEEYHEIGKHDECTPTKSAYYPEFWKKQMLLNHIFPKNIPLDKRQTKLGGQSVITKDKAVVRTDCIITYQIESLGTFIEKCHHLIFREYTDVEQVLEDEIHIPLQMALRTVFGNHTIEEILDNRLQLQEELMEHLKPLTDEYCITIQKVFIRDISIGKELQNIMNQGLIAEKKAQVRAIERRDEVAANRSLINTSKLLEEHPSAGMLRKLQTVENICEKIQNLNLTIGQMNNI